MDSIKCRHCNEKLEHVFVDLGLSPVSNEYLRVDDISHGQRYLPLKVYVCDNCKLVQVEEVKIHDQIFNEDYAYFSSYSQSWLKHCENYVNMIVSEFDIDLEEEYIVELASNDGYLLQYFKKLGYKVVGVEPSASTAKVAIEEKGIDTIIEFFGRETATKIVADRKPAKLIIANNVLAHVPDINDFVSGIKTLLDEQGLATIEFPHLKNLIQKVEFDTIYHEHYSYLSLITIENIMKSCQMKVFKVDRLDTHGGSLRVYITHEDNDRFPIDQSVKLIREEEISIGMDSLVAYQDFQNRVNEIKMSTLMKLIELKKEGKKIVGFGAPAKGNTFLNYTGIGLDFIDYTVDDTPLKQDKYLPGTLIPVYKVDKIFETKPDYVFILPWNLKDEIIEKMIDIKTWGGQFIIAIPELQII